MEWKRNIALAASAALLVTVPGSTSVEGLTPAIETPSYDQMIKTQLLEVKDDPEKLDLILSYILNTYEIKDLLFTLTISNRGTATSEEEITFSVHNPDGQYFYKAPEQGQISVSYLEALKYAQKILQDPYV